MIYSRNMNSTDSDNPNFSANALETYSAVSPSRTISISV